MHTMVWASGHQLQGGKYIIEQVLGQGGFGITYKAKHLVLNNFVVIKTPNESLKHDPEYPNYIKRFIDEGQRLEQLSQNQHPNIVRIRDLFHEGGTYCLVMDFVRGDSLFTGVQQRGALPPKEALLYITQIGSALKIVHQAGLVHRDAHPGNIMIQQDGKAVLIDFGIAGETMPTTVSSKFFGNPGFAPHEQMRGDRKPYVDVYCLAASLYYAVTGKRPTESFNRKAYNMPLVPPIEHVPTISNQLNSAILKGMELEPENRPKTMQEWLELLVEEVTIWQKGRQLQNGKYTIEKEIAQGGFGITYLALDANKQRVVIKSLNETVQKRPDFAKLQQDFLNEAVKLAKCNHPHIVKVSEVFQEGILWCMAMEYIEGEHLADRVANTGVLRETEAVGYIQQIGEALTVVHNNALLHRDVKPANIIIDAKKQKAILIDFGIAREFIPSQTKLHTPYLSHCFAPIEQYQTLARRGAYTDVYALAATLYFLVTKKLPHPAVNRASGAVLEEPKSINSSLSNCVNKAILKGMELEPENRPQTMQEWLQLLRETPKQNSVQNKKYSARLSNTRINVNNGAIISFDYQIYLRRVLAFLLDGILCVFLAASIINEGGSSIYLFYDNLRKWITSNIYYSDIPSLFYIIIFFVSWLYFTLFESSSIQATPGKFIFNIVISDMKGKKVSFLQASWRFLLTFVFFDPQYKLFDTLEYQLYRLGLYLLSYYLIPSLFNKKRPLQDIISRTSVFIKKH